MSGGVSDNDDRIVANSVISEAFKLGPSVEEAEAARDEMRDLDALPREAFLPPVVVRKYGTTVPISRDTALDLGLVQPTPAEQQQREAGRVEYAQRKQAATAALPVFVAQLAAVTDPVARAVLDLHEDDNGRCSGCEDYEGYGPGWPCETTVAVAKALGIPVPPDLDMAER